MELFSSMPAAVPLADGVRVFAYGFGGVFVALALLAGGTRLITVLAGWLEKKTEEKS